MVKTLRQEMLEAAEMQAEQAEAPVEETQERPASIKGRPSSARPDSPAKLTADASKPPTTVTKKAQSSVRRSLPTPGWGQAAAVRSASTGSLKGNSGAHTSAKEQAQSPDQTGKQVDKKVVRLRPGCESTRSAEFEKKASKPLHDGLRFNLGERVDHKASRSSQHESPRFGE